MTAPHIMPLSEADKQRANEHDPDGHVILQQQVDYECRQLMRYLTAVMRFSSEHPTDADAQQFRRAFMQFAQSTGLTFL